MSKRFQRGRFPLVRRQSVAAEQRWLATELRRSAAILRWSATELRRSAAVGLTIAAISGATVVLVAA